jgi:outer membrane protein
MKKLLLACLFALAPFSLASADLKVAVIDLSKAFDQYYKTQEAQDRLKTKQEGYEKEIQDLINDYQQMGTEAQHLSDQAKDPTLSAQARADKQTALDAKKQDMINLGNKIQEMKVERGRELQDERFRRHQEIVDEISKVVTNYAGPQGYDLVIDKSSASTASGVSIILYNSAKLTDITADIIKLLNASAPPTAATGTTTSTTAATPATTP